MPTPSSLYDRPNSFGWISIALHWSTAILLIALWFVGMSIMYQSPEAIDGRRSLHITLGLIAWVPLAARIAWRVKTPHPHANGQSLQMHRLACAAHYTILATLTVMLITGPLMAWLLPARTTVVDVALLLHSNAAKLLALLVVLHIAAALKHFMFHDDETIARIFSPKKTR